MTAGRRAVLGGASMAMMAALAGCASRVINYYRLAVIAGAPDPGRTGIITVRPVSLPGYLDQNGIARPGGDYRVETFDDAAWAAPLGDMLQAVMVQDLAQRLPGATILASGGAIGTTPDLVVEIAVQRFDFSADGRMTLVAQLAVKTGTDRGMVAHRRIDAATALNGADATASVAAMSGLWAQCADDITAMLAGG